MDEAVHVRSHKQARLVLFGAACLVSTATWLWADLVANEPATPATNASRESGEAKFVTETLSGRVVWLAEALRRKYDIESDEDSNEWLVALETSDGPVWPIVKDARGRGFRLDERLRDVDLELLVRRYEGSPMIQVIQVHRRRDGKKYELDYWCDVCAIPMYELKPCECCQGPTRLRERVVDKDAPR